MFTYTKTSPKTGDVLINESIILWIVRVPLLLYIPPLILKTFVFVIASSTHTK